MDKTIDKELLSQILKLESHQQELVLSFIRDLLTNSEMNQRAEASEQAISYGAVKSFDQFNSDFENWRAKKKSATK